MKPIFEVVSPGMGLTIQDLGRVGWKRFGVPPSGAMDSFSAMWANRLVGNGEAEPVIEILLQGAQLKVATHCRVAVTGADVDLEGIPQWEGVDLRAGASLRWKQARAGIWSYLAVAGGFAVPRWLGSASVYTRGGIGRNLGAGDVVQQNGSNGNRNAVARSWLRDGVRRDFSAPPILGVWAGPQWSEFDPEETRFFLRSEWEVSPRSDRVGYRLQGARLNAPAIEMISEPVIVGSVQVPPNGQPIVTMRDGPTVGGYPKIAVVDPNSLVWLAQCQPGIKFHFARLDD